MDNKPAKPLELLDKHIEPARSFSLLKLLAVVFVLSLPLGWMAFQIDQWRHDRGFFADDLRGRAFTYVDLQERGNARLDDLTGDGDPGGDVSALPTGVQRLGDAEFQIQQRCLQLGGQLLRSRPMYISDVPVGKAFHKLHLLHATMWGGPGPLGDQMAVADGVVVGRYVLHYEDGSSQAVPIVYGQDVRDWWNWDHSAAVTRGRIAWTGENRYARQFGVSVRLYVMSWDNPYPEEIVVSVDFVSANTAAAPFCVAMSVED